MSCCATRIYVVDVSRARARKQHEYEAPNYKRMSYHISCIYGALILVNDHNVVRETFSSSEGRDAQLAFVSFSLMYTCNVTLQALWRRRETFVAGRASELPLLSICFEISPGIHPFLLMIHGPATRATRLRCTTELAKYQNDEVVTNADANLNAPRHERQRLDEKLVHFVAAVIRDAAAMRH